MRKTKPDAPPSRHHEKYDRLIAAALSNAPLAAAVAHPCDESSLLGAIEASAKKLIRPILVGPAKKIRALADTHALDIRGLEIVDAAQPVVGIYVGRTRTNGQSGSSDEGKLAL
jgi:phosphotransacetylase